MKTIVNSKYKMRPLGDVARFLRGITFKPDDVVEPGTDDSVVCMRTANVQADLDQSNLLAVPKQFVRREELYLQETDILVSTANSWNLVGKCCWVPRLDYEATAGGFISILRANSAKIVPRYLYRWFNSDAVQHLVRLCGRQTTNISNMSFERCESLEVPLPSLPEQRRIADILDKADAIRRKRQESTDLTMELLKSSYLHLFGNPRRVSKSWEVEPLGDVCSVDRGKFTPRPRNDPKYYGGPHPFIQTGDITSSGGLLSKWKQTLNDEGVAVSRSFRPGTVVIAIVGATIGETAILMREMYCPDSVIGISPRHDKVTSEYVEFTLRFFKQHFRDMAPETARANINLDTLRPLDIPIPPMSLQQQFSQMFRKCYEMKQKVVDPRDETDDLFNSLVQRAFGGEL
jgi:type I restriction enzyme S subunit